MELIAGVQLMDVCVHVDARGELAAFESFSNLPFALERAFFINAGDPKAIRGGHANSCDEFIVALAGSVLVETDNGGQRTEIRLSSPRQGLWVGPGVAIRLKEFATQTILLVCASARYRETRHFQPPPRDAAG